MATRKSDNTDKYVWKESYIAALLETDWTKMPERIQAAESAICERQRALYEDHGGIPHERQALKDATSGLNVLRQELIERQGPQSPGSAKAAYPGNAGDNQGIWIG